MPTKSKHTPEELEFKSKVEVLMHKYNVTFKVVVAPADRISNIIYKLTKRFLKLNSSVMIVSIPK